MMMCTGYSQKYCTDLGNFYALIDWSTGYVNLVYNQRMPRNNGQVTDTVTIKALNTRLMNYYKTNPDSFPKGYLGSTVGYMNTWYNYN